MSLYFSRMKIIHYVILCKNYGGCKRGALPSTLSVFITSEEIRYGCLLTGPTIKNKTYSFCFLKLISISIYIIFTTFGKYLHSTTLPAKIIYVQEVTKKLKTKTAIPTDKYSQIFFLLNLSLRKSFTTPKSTYK